jgi:hypothetical protein
MNVNTPRQLIIYMYINSNKFSTPDSIDMMSSQGYICNAMQGIVYASVLK